MRVLTALSVEGLVCFDDLSRSLGRVNLLMGRDGAGKAQKIRSPLAWDA
jgi:predicted ATPase